MEPTKQKVITLAISLEGAVSPVFFDVRLPEEPQSLESILSNTFKTADFLRCNDGTWINTSKILFFRVHEF